MEEFLTSCQRAVKSVSSEQPQCAAVQVVLGNEACDLDSMVSSLAYAYFLFKSSSANETLAFPLLNISQSELLLRPDCLFLLRQTGLSPELLLFRNQLDLLALSQTGCLRLTLVDHNILPSTDSVLEGSVVEVIDHHLLERSPSPSCPVTVEMVGSCATLVTERIITAAPHILDLQLATLLYGAIVCDCVNMSPSAGKVTAKDSLYAAALESRFPSLPPRGALFQALHNAKFDVSGLNTEQMLLKDMKVVSGSLNMAVCVLYVTLEDFLQRAELEADLSSFCQKFAFDSLLLMTITFTESKEPIRELAVFSLSTPCREQVSQYLEQARSPALLLYPISSPHFHISAYQQGNTLASRKKLLPLVKDFLRQRRADGCRGDEEGEEEEGAVPPTPMNSLVDGCPLDGGLPHLSAQDLEDKFSKMTSDL